MASQQSTSELGIRASGDFPAWLHASGVSLVFTTYQTHRLFFVGLTPEGKLSGFERLFNRPMGLHATPERLTMATRYQIRELVNVLSDGETHENYDRVYVPRRAYTTGALDAHDVHRGPDGQILFVNTRYSCLAEPSSTHSFRPVWQPSFLSRLLPEDRCHLNGLATDADGHPRYVTAVSRSDVAAGWRDRRAEGGIVMDVDNGEIVADGLSMPHSPRLYDEDLYLINAGSGELGRIDRARGTFEPIAFCPGYGRGLTFHEGYALVGLSKPRRSQAFQGLGLSDALEVKDVDAKCGLFVIELSTGRAAHWMEFTSIIEEIYDVQVLPGVRRPMALGFKTDEIQRFITMETTDGPVRHLITLDDEPSPADGRSEVESRKEVSSDEPPASFELPQRRDGGARLSGDEAYQFQTAPMTVGEAHDRFGGLLPGRFRRRLASGALSPDTPLTGVLAHVGGSLVGLAAADTTTHSPHGVVHAIGVLPDHRGQGIGTQLLRRLEAAARQDGIETMQAQYRSTLPSVPAIERLVEKQSWESPHATRRLYGGRRDLVTDAFLDALPQQLPEGNAFPWGDLTDGERRAIHARLNAPNAAVPQALSPFQMEERIKGACSLGLRHNERVAGWVITHRISAEVLQYTCLYVQPELRGPGVGPALLGLAVRRYVEQTDVPRCVWMVDADKPPVQRFVERTLAPVIDSQADEMRVQKRL